MIPEHLTSQRFDDFALAEPLKRGLAEAEFTLCTPIQAAALPEALEGHDIAGQAQTGTGKTIAFLLATAHYLLERTPQNPAKDRPRALILAPTRELAIQIHQDAQLILKHCGFRFGLIYGGTGYDSQRATLEAGCDILIATPGRLLDFLRQGLFRLDAIEVVVIDEADRMFDLGFIRDLRYLLRRMPPAGERLNLLFSATLSMRVMEMAYEHMNDPREIKIRAEARLAENLSERGYYPAEEEKLPLLINLLGRKAIERVLIFVNTRRAAEYVSQRLRRAGLDNSMISGDVPQDKRERLLAGFKSGKVRILVATDVAARGLHIPSVAQVYNYDLPQDPEDYVHRAGRTARAGASGEVISFICEKYAYSLIEIERFIGHEVPRHDMTDEDLRKPEKLELAPEAEPESEEPEPKPKSRASHPTKPKRAEAPIAETPEAPTEETPEAPITEEPEPVIAEKPEAAAQTPEPETKPAPQLDTPSAPKPAAKPVSPPPAVRQYSDKFGEVPLIG